MNYLFSIFGTASTVATIALVIYRILYTRASARNPVFVDPAMFPDRLQITPIDEREDYFRVLVTYHVISLVRGVAKVLNGFDTDFLSIPWFARAYLSPNSRYRRGAVQHDRDYWEQDVSRRLADAAFGEEMASLDSKVTNAWDRRILQSARFIIYYSLRAFGWFAWWNNARKRRKEAAAK